MIDGSVQATPTRRRAGILHLEDFRLKLEHNPNHTPDLTRVPTFIRESSKELFSLPQKVSGISSSTVTRNVCTPRQETQTSKGEICTSSVRTYHLPSDT